MSDHRLDPAEIDRFIEWQRSGELNDLSEDEIEDIERKEEEERTHDGARAMD